MPWTAENNQNKKKTESKVYSCDRTTAESTKRLKKNLLDRANGLPMLIRRCCAESLRLVCRYGVLACGNVSGTGFVVSSHMSRSWRNTSNKHMWCSSIAACFCFLCNFDFRFVFADATIMWLLNCSVWWASISITVVRRSFIVEALVIVLDGKNDRMWSENDRHEWKDCLFMTTP